MNYTKHEGKMKDFYKIGKTLGEGSFAVVRDVTCLKDDSKWAAKCIDKKNLSKILIIFCLIVLLKCNLAMCLIFV